MLAKDIMTTEVVTATPEMTVEALMRLLLDKGVGAVPVVGPGGEVLGVVSEADLVRRLRSPHRKKWWLALSLDHVELAREFARLHARRVADVMRKPAVTVKEETPVSEIARILEEKQIKRVPVIREGRLVGIVSRRDLVRVVAIRPSRAPAEVLSDDAAIHRRISDQLKHMEWLESSSVHVGVVDGLVRLIGVVPHTDVRRALRVLVEEIPGVRGVEDRLLLEQQVSPSE